mmetsp:Transcript_3358/g.2808  ORF Transcript_3358/g.2808 Transcript_3358/m.2808 type:complete len:93 (-) Transcript_3358:224-502(-)
MTMTNKFLHKVLESAKSPKDKTSVRKSKESGTIEFTHNRRVKRGSASSYKPAGKIKNKRYHDPMKLLAKRGRNDGMNNGNYHSNIADSYGIK